MTELSSQTRALLEITRSSDGPTETDRQRLANALATKVGIGAPILLGGASVGALPQGGATAAAAIAAGNATATPVTSLATLLSSAGVKVVLAGLVGAAVGLATMTPVVLLAPGAPEVQPAEPLSGDGASGLAPGELRQREPSAAKNPTSGGEPVPGVVGGNQSPRATAAGGVQSPHPSVSDSTPAAPLGNSAAERPKAAASLSREAELLAAVQGELSANKPERALELLDEHERAYSSGALSEERQAARVLALCQAGQRETARYHAIEFLKAAPRSPLVPRIQSSCAFSAQNPAAPKAGRSPQSPLR